MVRISNIQQYHKMNLTILVSIWKKDIGALSEDSFDSVDWINKTLKITEEQKSKEVDRFNIYVKYILKDKHSFYKLLKAVVSSLVAKLQLYVQQVNSALEETSQQVLVSMPRIMSDAQVCKNIHK